MSDFPVFDRHLGVWEGTYTMMDAKTGEVLDRHRSRLTCKIDGDQWWQRNEYMWDDGRSDTKEFGGEFKDGKLCFDTPRLVGEAVEADDVTIVLRWVYTHDKSTTYSEIITLDGDDHRGRTWQHFVDGEFTQLTVIDERKVA